MRAPSLMEKVLIVELIFAATATAASMVSAPVSDVSSGLSLDANEFSTNTTHFFTVRAEDHAIEIRSEDQCKYAKGKCLHKKKVLKKCKGIIDTSVTCNKKNAYCCMPDVTCPTSPAPTTTITTDPTECPDGWVYGGPNLGCILFGTSAKSWDDARGHCQGLGGGADLAVLDTNDKLVEMANATARGTSYWVGGNDRSGTWQWITGGNSVSSGWRPDQPNDDSGDDTCTYISYAGITDMILDLACTRSINYFICQK